MNTFYENLLTIRALVTTKGLSGLKTLPLIGRFRSPRFLYALSEVRDVQEVMFPRLNLIGASERAYSDFTRLEDTWRNEILKGYRPGGRPNVNSLILYSLVRELKPDTIIETGVASGVSSYFILKALAENNRGILISIDLPNLSDPKGYVNKDGRRDFVYTPPDRGVGWLVPQRLKSRWKLVFGNSLDLLPQIEVKPDLFYHDSDHSYPVMMKEYDWAYNNGSKFILSDDISWSRAWMEFVTKNALSHVEVSDMGVAAMRKQTG